MSLAKRVLLVEDDELLARPIIAELERVGYSVTHESNGSQALSVARTEVFDLVVLDLTLPSMDGVELCRALRSESRVPILIITGRIEASDAVAAFAAGADDYVRKPFHIPELIARIEAVLRRVGEPQGMAAVEVGDLLVDPKAHRVLKSGREVSLSATEFRLLYELARNAGQVMSRELLLRKVWDYGYLGASRLVDMAVTRLRSKLDSGTDGSTVIQTVRGAGYRLDVDGIR